MGAGSHRKKHTRSGASSLRTLYLGPILAYEADRWQRRYAVLRYDGVFEGLAWIIEDSTGANDFQDFLDSLAHDPDILWFEPDFEVTLPPSNARGGGSGQQVPWSVAAIDLMRKKGVSCLPVLKGEKLVGLVTEADFMPIAYQLLEKQLMEESTEE